MEAKSLVGPNAGSLKYDILTALSVAGLHGTPMHQVSMARLGVLLTARYNWRREELSVGQRDMARIWNVTERTVKREVKRWIDQKVLICKRPGVRGRVGAYRLNLPAIFRMSEPYWNAIGPDFAERMLSLDPVQESKVVQVNFGQPDPMEETGLQKGTWRAVLQRFRQLHPQDYSNWVSALKFLSDDGQHIQLSAQTKFAMRYIETHLMDQLNEAVEAEIGPQRRISFVVQA